MILPCFPLIVNEKFSPAVFRRRAHPGGFRPPGPEQPAKYKTPSALTEGRSVLLRVFFGRDKSQCDTRHCITAPNLASRFFGVNRIGNTSDFSLVKLTKIDTKSVFFRKFARKSAGIPGFRQKCVTFSLSKSFKFCEVSVFVLFSSDSHFPGKMPLL